ncbi:Tryptophan 2,3-dioxygenase [Rubellimicrobium mesophilum DSM 19309]|uniref:Tryptophan 2,3-dioxygenase n=1 Tax=Rubellimicrobium mesophilum DSM 19309 TaxID=442562 RepID=A0A017HRP0_9RHOB|nr:Tryptophan 2,3-dioxygenase [Rubellimicrobium mesophilum DSM 19309]
MSDYDPAEEGAHTDFAGRMAYGDYLRLDRILGAQKPLTDAHDEMLFVIQHQVSELWMRLAIHEIAAARRSLAQDRAEPALKMLARVSRIFEQLNNAWDVLRTMTPSEYTRFRSQLGQSSGFQSLQYRQIEYMLGNRNAAMLRPHAHVAESSAKLEEELATPSLYDEALRFADRHGVPMPPRSSPATSARPTASTRASWKPGAWSTNPPTPIGGSTSWPRSWWTSRTTSAAGASTTSPPWSASSASSAAPAAPGA